MISFPRTPDEAIAENGEIRAGGTDLQERRRSGVSQGRLVDLRDMRGLDRIESAENETMHIGAMVRIASLAHDERVLRHYPGLASAAAHLATPQIRAVGTVGGNLLQRTRCWYYRHPATSCYKKGGDSCPARSGNHLYAACFDLGPCVAPHPSTLGMALLAYDAHVEIHGGPSRSVAELFGDGSDPHHDHRLIQDELLMGVILPEPVEGEHAAYFRVISRAFAEWPLVEVIVRLVVRGTIRFARVAVGGVANIPLRLHRVEEMLLDQPAIAKTFEQAAAAAIEGANPLPLTRYKVNLLQAAIIETLERILLQINP